ncbi:MAG: HipA domain-containing protein [Janthinobacterium lividum]
MQQPETPSLDLARAAGIDACEARLAPLSAIDAEHSHALPDEPGFLGVTRFDRDGAGAGAGAGAGDAGFPSLGEPALMELVRRPMVNDLLGNPCAHLKNFGVPYADGIAPRLAPVYDIVAFDAMQGADGHALPLVPAPPHPQDAASPKRAPRPPFFTPISVRAFCHGTGLNEPLMRRTIADTGVRYVRPGSSACASGSKRTRWMQGLARRGT